MRPGEAHCDCRAGPLTTARFVRPLVLHQPSRFASASPVLRQTSHFASDLPICISVHATHAPCPRRRSDAFDALQLEFTVYLLTTWRQHKQMALMDFPKALVQNCRLSQAPARCRCHSLPAGWRGRKVLARAALRTPSLRGHASRPFPSGSIPLWRCRQCVPTALILRRFQSRTRERIEHMVPRIEAGSIYQIKAVGTSTPPPGAHPPYSDVGAAPEADGVSVVKTRVYVYVHNSSVHGSRTTR